MSSSNPNVDPDKIHEKEHVIQTVMEHLRSLEPDVRAACPVGLRLPSTFEKVAEPRRRRVASSWCYQCASVHPGVPRQSSWDDYGPRRVIHQMVHPDRRRSCLTSRRTLWQCTTCHELSAGVPEGGRHDQDHALRPQRPRFSIGERARRAAEGVREHASTTATRIGQSRRRSRHGLDSRSTDVAGAPDAKEKKRAVVVCGLRGVTTPSYHPRGHRRQPRHGLRAHDRTTSDLDFGDPR